MSTGVGGSPYSTSAAASRMACTRGLQARMPAAGERAGDVGGASVHSQDAGLCWGASLQLRDAARVCAGWQAVEQVGGTQARGTQVAMRTCQVLIRSCNVPVLEPPKHTALTRMTACSTARPQPTCQVLVRVLQVPVLEPPHPGQSGCRRAAQPSCGTGREGSAAARLSLQGLPSLRLSMHTDKTATHRG